MPLGFAKRGDAAVACDRLGTSVVGRKSQRALAELVEHHQQVAGRSVEVLRRILRIDAEIAGGLGHKLPKPYGTDRAACSGIVCALDFDVGSVKERPISDGKPRATQRTMPGIP